MPPPAVNKNPFGVTLKAPAKVPAAPAKEVNKAPFEKFEPPYAAKNSNEPKTFLKISPNIAP